jgi:peptidoglycan/LPS O-acetylase OafA/YrhL
MLTYAYSGLNRAQLGRFYWRRFLSAGIPYLCWSVIYFLFRLPASHYASVSAAFRSLALMAATGYYQLYFLLVIMQFYLVFPLVLMLLRRARGHHGLVVALAVLAQVAIAIGMHWNLFPAVMVKFGQQDALSYLLYLVGGCVVAFHLDQVHEWVCTHARLIVVLTVAAAFAAEGVYFLAANGVTTVLGSGNDPFQPSVIPFNIGAVTCGYLAGVALGRPHRSRRVRAAVRSGSDNAYGIYLSHMLFITTLTWVGWGKLSSVIPWPVLCLATVAIVVAFAVALTCLLARTPLAVPLTGRTQVPWRRPRPLTLQSAAAASDRDGMRDNVQPPLRAA